jgi:hypothetical protein
VSLPAELCGLADFLVGQISGMASCLGGTYVRHAHSQHLSVVVLYLATVGVCLQAGVGQRDRGEGPRGSKNTAINQQLQCKLNHPDLCRQRPPIPGSPGPQRTASGDCATRGRAVRPARGARAVLDVLVLGAREGARGGGHTVGRSDRAHRGRGLARRRAAGLLDGVEAHEHTRAVGTNRGGGKGQGRGDWGEAERLAQQGGPLQMRDEHEASLCRNAQ